MVDRTSREKEVNLPYTLEKVDGGNYCVTYTVPRDVAGRLAGRPVAANGGLFELTQVRIDGQQRLQTVFFSPKPEKTADAIGKVLCKRMALEDPDVECSIS
eukprot:s761_g12.t1